MQYKYFGALAAAGLGGCALSKEAEQRVFELRALGLSVARVAAQLNEEAVLTAHGGKAWHATTGSSIDKRTAEVR